MLGRQVYDAGRGKRRKWLGLTLAALLVSVAALVTVAVQFVSEAELTLQHVAEQADLSVRLRQLQGVQVGLVDAETGQRGYLLTGSERYLAPYRAAIARLPALMRGFDESVAQDRVFDQKAEDARQLIADKLAELEQTVKLQADGQHDAAMALVLSDKGQDYMERARVEIGEVLDIVRARRDRIGVDIADSVVHIQRLLLLAVSSLLVFIALAVGQTLQTLAARARFERTLALSEQRHRALIEDQSELVSLAREDGTLVYVNPAFARHFGRTAAEMVGTNRYDLVDEAERDTTRIEVAGVLRSGRERSSETRMMAADGLEHWVSWTNKRRLEPDGTLLHSVGRDITDRKRSDRAMRASQSFLHRTSRLAGVGGWEQDLQTGTGVWSEEVRRILEVDDDYVPRRLDAVASYAPEGREQIEKAVADCIERGVSWDLELPRFTASGRRIWVRTVGSLEFENGQPRRIVGALQDITARKQLEQRLAEGEHFLRQLTDNLPVRIAYFDTRSRYRFVNWAHCQRFGKTREEIIGHTRSALSHGRTDAVVEPHILAVLRGEPQHFEYEETVGKHVRRIEANLMPDIGEDGRVRGFYSTGVDITERTVNERRLRDLTQILDLDPDFVVQTDRHGGVQYMNPAVRRALGIGADESLSGRRFTEFNTPSTNERYLGEIQAALRKHGFWLGETTVLLAGDRVVPVNHLVIAHRDVEGRVERFSAVMRDISAEVAARDALQLQTATLQSVIEALPAMIAVVGADGRYRFVNKAFERWIRLPRERLLGHPIQDAHDAQEYARLAPWIARTLAGETVSFEIHDERRDVRHLGVTYVPLRIGDRVDGLVGMALDITSHKDEAGRLLQLTRRDAHTGLLNPAGLQHWAAQHTRRDGLDVAALLHIALDHFKPVNDTFGLAAGDEVLRQFGQRLQEIAGPGAAVARIGGDLFAVALAEPDEGLLTSNGTGNDAHDVTGTGAGTTGTDPERSPGQALAARIIAASGLPFPVGALDILVSASVGAAERSAGDDWPALVARAQARLLESKSGAGNRAS